MYTSMYVFNTATVTDVLINTSYIVYVQMSSSEIKDASKSHIWPKATPSPNHSLIYSVHQRTYGPYTIHLLYDGGCCGGNKAKGLFLIPEPQFCWQTGATQPSVTKEIFMKNGILQITWKHQWGKLFTTEQCRRSPLDLWHFLNATRCTDQSDDTTHYLKQYKGATKQQLSIILLWLHWNFSERAQPVSKDTDKTDSH